MSSSTDFEAETAPSGSTQNRALLQSVQRAFAVLDILSTGVPRTVAELTSELGLERTTVQRIVRTLQVEDMVEVVNGRLKLGGRALLIGSSYHNSLPLRDVALPYMIDLQRSNGSTQIQTIITVRYRNEVIIVDRVWDPEMRLDLIYRYGWRFPLDESASGIALLAEMPHDEAEALLSPERMRALEPVIKTTRELGYAFFRNPVQHESCAMAAIVRSRDGAPAGALAVIGVGLDPDGVPDDKLGARLRQYARQIGSVL